MLERHCSARACLSTKVLPSVCVVPYTHAWPLTVSLHDPLQARHAVVFFAVVQIILTWLLGYSNPGARGVSGCNITLHSCHPVAIYQGW